MNNVIKLEDFNSIGQKPLGIKQRREQQKEEAEKLEETESRQVSNGMGKRDSLVRRTIRKVNDFIDNHELLPPYGSTGGPSGPRKDERDDN